MPPLQPRRTTALCLLATLLAAGVSSGGGGPQNVLLVVNSARDDSKQVANHYVRLRALPASNVLYLNYRGDPETISGEAFREQILGPVLTAITVRGLALQVDTIAYSCGFPWRVQLRDDFPEGAKFTRANTPTASLTGATFLWQSVLLKSASTVTLGANWYAGGLGPANRGRCAKLSLRQSRAFRGGYAWRQNGLPLVDGKGGRRYFLSTMLGVTTGRGNTVDEVLDCLRRSAYADASPPSGAFYFMRNGDVRSVTRHACYDQVADALRGLGAEAVVEKGVVPKPGSVVAGMMLGAANPPLRTAGLRIQPGAICEHLTSAGGDLRSDGIQTPLSEMIRAGAAGASGTVTEPLALQAKFPAASIHLHYRRGSSLAEAFYLSVAAPYQLLVVGDPLCQPWAQRPTIEIDGWPQDGSDEPRSEGLSLTPRVTAVNPRPAPSAHWDLYVDGRLKTRAFSGAQFELTPEELGPGWRSLRCVGVDPGPLEWQASLSTAVCVAREGALGPVRMTTERRAPSLGDRVSLNLDAPGAERVEVLQNSRVLGEIEGPSGSLEIAASELGRGPVRLQAVARPDGAASAPLWISVE